MRRIKRAVAGLLLLFMFISLVPLTEMKAFGATKEFTYKLILRTHGDGGGTYGYALTKVNYYTETGGTNSSSEQTKEDLDGTSTYTYTYNSSTPPWMIKSVWIRHNAAWHAISDKLGVNYLNLSLPDINNNTDKSSIRVITDKWYGNKDEETFSVNTKRKITDTFFTGIASGLNTVYMGEDDKNNYKSPGITDKGRGIFVNVPIYVTDQYGTYNPMDYMDSPGQAELTLTPSGGTNPGNATSLLRNNIKYEMKDGKFTFHPTENFWQIMNDYSLNEVKCNLKWTFPSQSTQDQRVFELNITYRRKAFKITSASLSAGQSVGSLQYFNINKNTLMVTLVIGNDVGASNITLASNFTGNLSLHKGNLDGSGKLGEKICDLKKYVLPLPLNIDKIFYVLDTPDNKFPSDYTTGDDDLYLHIDDASSSIDANNKNFPLVSVEKEPKNGKYFDGYRIDTLAPTVYIVDEFGGEKTISGVNNSGRTHKFYMKSNEKMDVLNRNGVLEKGKVAYSLLDEDGNPLILKGYQEGSGTKDTEIYAPVDNQVIKNTEITLAMDEDENREGIFTLKIRGQDIALNSMEKTVANVYMDNKAPEVAIKEIKVTEENDDSKRHDYSFNISDFSGSGKLYYCFVEDGKSIPSIGGESYGIDDTNEGTWYFKNWSKDQTDEITASYKVAKDQDFTGKLYYYVVDKHGNGFYKEEQYQEVNIYNGDVKGSIEVVGTSQEGKPDYTINFNNSVNEKLSYRWIETNTGASGFIQEALKVYLAENIGSSQHIGDDKETYTFDGNYKLEYKIENTESHNYIEGSMNFIFDNSYPQIDLPIWTNGQNISDVQQATIKITDKGGLKEAKYRIVDVNNSPIEGLHYINLPINNGRVDTTVNISIPESLGNGIYGIEIKAEDNNENSKTVMYDYVAYTKGNPNTLHDGITASDYAQPDMRLGIRMLPPVLSLEKVEALGGNTILESGDVDNKRYITGNSQYSVTIKTEEAFKNLSSFNYNTYAKYQYSSDGLNWTDWKRGSSTYMHRESEGYREVVTIDKPIDLIEGMNTIYIRAACFENPDATTVAGKIISSPLAINIEVDKSQASYDISYDKTYRTNEDIIARLEIYKNNPLKTYRVELSESTEIEMEEVENTEESIVFELTIKKNLEETLSIFDDLGNKTENINIDVDWIDKNAPLANVESNKDINSGERKDRELLVKVEGTIAGITRFALLENNDNELSEDDFYQLSLMERDGHIKLTSTEELIGNGEVNQSYTIRLMGLEGSYKLGYASQDALGNSISKIIDGSNFSIEDLELNVKGTTFDPMITKSTTVGKTGFNVPVAILPSSQVTTDSAFNLELAADYGKDPANLKLIHEFIYSDTSPRTYYVSDEIGRSRTISVSPAGQVDFINGFGSTVSYELNGNSVTLSPDKWIGLRQDGDLKAYISSASGYEGKQYFYVTSSSAINGIIGDARINEELSTEAVNNIEELAGEKLYSQLVFDILTNRKTIKQFEFQSYTNEGMKEDRIETEHIAIENIDESPPSVTWSLSNIAPTNQPVIAYINYSDSESGVAKFEAKLNSGSYQEIDISSGGRVEKILNEKDDIWYIKVTNNAGLVSTESAIRAENIDKTPIEEGTHYKVDYYYEDYKGDYQPIEEGKSYRKIKAVIVPIEGSGKELSISNNNGSFERILEDDIAFTINIKDSAGNTSSQQLRYDKFDKAAPFITQVSLSNTKKTNQNITVTVKAEDTDKINDIVHFEAYYNGINGQIKLIPEKISQDQYTFTAENSGNYTLYVWDLAGNMGQKDYTISNINKETPKLLRTEYSVAPTVKTNQYVMVTLKEFDKENVRLTGNIEPVSGSFSLSDVLLYINERSLRFKKNGSVNVEFIDEYGNTGIAVITVDNIKTEPPQCKAVFDLAENKSHAIIKFESLKGEGGNPLELDLSKISIKSGIVGTSSQKADDTEIKVNKNGLYNFVLSDEVGNIQNVSVTVSGIDKEPPKITGISWKYDYSEKENQEWIQKTEEGSHIPENQKGYSISKDDGLPETNKDVEVTVTTDKEIVPIGSKREAKKEAKVKFTNNGVFSFDLEAVNDTSVLYGVSVDLIDKSNPVIKFDNSDELIFIKDDTRTESKYDKSKLYDFTAYDYDDNGNLVELPVENVEIDFTSNDRTFNPDHIDSNEFNRTKPYYITYRAYDDVGNETLVTRSVRLIGPTDTIALIDGSMPNANNISSVNKDNFTVSLKNHSGKVYVKYLGGMNTMGEMKYAGKAVSQDKDGSFKIGKLSSGWYTVNVQTDKKDFFNIHVYVNSEK